MDFYSYKLHQYSKNKSDLPIEERMIMVKVRAEEQAQNHYDKLRATYIQELSGGVSSGHVGLSSSGRTCMAMYQDMYVEASEDLQKIQNLSPEEYVNTLIASESEAILKYTDQRADEYTGATVKLTRLNTNKGIAAKLTNLFGKGDQIRETMAEKIDLLNQQFTLAEASQETWTHMSEENRVEYVLARSENDGILGFDKEGIESLGKNPYLMSKENDSAQGESLDTTSDFVE